MDGHGSPTLAFSNAPVATTLNTRTFQSMDDADDDETDTAFTHYIWHLVGGTTLHLRSWQCLSKERAAVFD